MSQIYAFSTNSISTNVDFAALFSLSMNMHTLVC